MAKKTGFITTRHLDFQVGSNLPSSWNKAGREHWRLLVARKDFLKVLKGDCDTSMVVLAPVGVKCFVLMPVLPLV